MKPSLFSVASKVKKSLIISFKKEPREGLSFASVLKLHFLGAKL